MDMAPFLDLHNLAGPWRGQPLLLQNTACEDDDMSPLAIKREDAWEAASSFFFQQDLLDFSFQKESQFYHLFCLKMLEDADVGIHVWYICLHVLADLSIKINQM